ncbi:hypothetical protein VRK_08920 [Vibrio sp. MEBiC08052]|nr:hypothetical protein VRK_08920 [Vibrio sp. MEBiC08052]
MASYDIFSGFLLAIELPIGEEWGKVTAGREDGQIEPE